MTKFMQEQWPMFDGTHKMRDEFLDTLTDDDLNFSPGGTAITLGALCLEMGNVEYSYVEALKTFKQDWSYRNPEVGLEHSVSGLKAWWQDLDKQMESVISAFSEEDFQKTVDRGFQMPLDWELQAYLQAVLIFFGKATVYLHVMNKPLTTRFQEWIG